MKNKIAILDVDDTLFGGNLGIELVKSLVEKEVFTKEIGKEIFLLYEKYKNDELEKSVVVDRVYQLFARGLANKSEAEIDSIAQETWNSVKNKTFEFTDDLIQQLRSRSYAIILLSGSPVEMVRLFGKEFLIDDDEIIAGVVGISNGIYSGKRGFYPGSSQQKIEAITKYIREKNIDVDWNESFGMGNNERDLLILNKVGISYAFEPNEELKTTIDSEKSTIVNRANVIDRLGQTLKP